MISYEKISDLIIDLDDEQKAKLAAQILNECDPGRATMAAFYTNLEDTVRAELIGRGDEYID